MECITRSDNTQARILVAAWRIANLATAAWYRVAIGAKVNGKSGQHGQCEQQKSELGFQ
jgi:hypothetical protein